MHKKGMRELQTTDQEKALMMQILIDEILREYNDLQPVEKNFRSRAEKVGYKIITELEVNGFITNLGIQGKEKQLS